MSVLAVVKNVFPVWGMNPPPGWKLDGAGKNFDENNNQISPHCDHPTGCQSKLFDVIYMLYFLLVNGIVFCSHSDLCISPFVEIFCETV